MKRPSRKGRPKRGIYDLLRMQRLYLCLREWFKSDYEFAQELQRSGLALTGKVRAPNTLQTMLRKMRTLKCGRLGAEYIHMMAHAALRGLGGNERNELGEKLVLAKLKGVISADTKGRPPKEGRREKVGYVGWRYYQRLLSEDDATHPFVVDFAFFDDHDVAIDVAEVLSLPAKAVRVIEADILGKLQDSGKPDEAAIVAQLRRLCIRYRVRTNRLFVAMMIVFLHVSLRTKVLNIPYATGKLNPRAGSEAMAPDQQVAMMENAIKGLTDKLSPFGWTMEDGTPDQIHDFAVKFHELASFI